MKGFASLIVLYLMAKFFSIILFCIWICSSVSFSLFAVGDPVLPARFGCLRACLPFGSSFCTL